MVDAGLDPAQSRLALPGCTQPRLAFCDGTKHDCTVLVNERGEMLPAGKNLEPNGDYRLEAMPVATRPSATSPASTQGKLTEEQAVSSLVRLLSPSDTRTEVTPGA
jgi:hypothetical protein